MKISEVVEKLLSIQAAHGDLDVVNSYDLDNVEFVKYHFIEDDKDEFVEIY